jgi:hypothetical protein
VQSTSPISTSYRFERDKQSPSGFLSKNRASTDALSELHCWRNLFAGCSFSVTVDEDYALEATLAFSEDDADAGGQIDHLCAQRGGLPQPFGC